MDENPISKEVVDAAYKIHTTLGPGLLESVYEVTLAYELRKRGLRVVRQLPVPLIYEDICFEEGYRLDVGRRQSDRRNQIHRRNSAHPQATITDLPKTPRQTSRTLNQLQRRPNPRRHHAHCKRLTRMNLFSLLCDSFAP